MKWQGYLLSEKMNSIHGPFMRLGQNKIVDMKHEQYFKLAKEIYGDSCQMKSLDKTMKGEA